MNKFHRLTFLSDAGMVGKTRRWKMRCECGTERTFVAAEVKRGHTKSCGCLAVEWNKGAKFRKYRNGMTSSATYRSWNAMKSRCANPAKTYYFGKVRVCKRWDTFANFLADMGERPPGKTLDRINGKLGYTPANCRWATHQEQARNRRTARLISLRGETKTLAEWGVITGLGRVNIARRLQFGWTVEKALTTPIDVTRRPKG